MMNGHFWYSEKQANCYRSSSIKQFKNYATINGKKVLYTTMADNMDHGCAWDDLKYLGYGEYSHSDGVW